MANTQNENNQTEKTIELTLKSGKIENAEFHIGDVVTLKSHPLSNPLKTDVHAVPPAMVVVEVSKDKGKDKVKYDSLKGVKIGGGLIKYRCVFYATQESKFKDFWFYPEVLKKVEKNNKEILTFELGKKVTLRTFDFENSKRKESTVYSRESTINNTEEGNNPKKTTRKVENETTTVPLLTHLPPIMVISGFDKNTIDVPIFQANSQGESECIREISPYKIKCMWYNPIEAKFSEDWFIPEALFEVQEGNA